MQRVSRAARRALGALTAVGAAALTALALPVSAAQAATNGIPDYDLANYWAPVFLQDTDSSNYRGDYITRFDYDGDFYGKNNWNNLNRYALPAYVYYNVAETETHYFLTYADFHPQDWHEWNSLERHENDLEGVLVVIKKDGSAFGAFQLMVTIAHHDFYSYKDYHAYPSAAVGNNRESIDGDVQFWGTHPYVYVEAKGHGIYGAKRWETGGFPGGDGVGYYPTSSWGAAEVPQSGNDRYVPYRLLPLSTFWQLQHQPAYDNYTFAGWGKFLGDDGTDNAASLPWNWDDKDDGDIYAGDLYLRPARTISLYHGNLGDFSHHYLHSTDGAWRY